MSNEKPKYSGADAHIFVEKSYPEKVGTTLLDLLREHTRLPSRKEAFPKMTIFFGPGRSSSTAWALLAASHPNCIGAAYQPLKSIERHGPKYGEICVPCIENGRGNALTAGAPFWFMTKEVAGPFHPWEDIRPGIGAIDPFYLWTELGYPPELINGVVIIREPKEVFISNFKFEGGIDPRLLASNYQGVLDLYKYYKDKFPIVPFVFDLCNPFTFGAKTVVAATMNKIGVPFCDLQFNPCAIEKKLQLFEAAVPDEYKDIVEPTLVKGQFGYPLNHSKIPETKRDQIEPHLGFIEKQCGPIYRYFIIESKKALEL
ncbi:hypothetical protein A3F58_03385 [Candidatus Roizmanbacteria bacterium RIFCSPHIGHO2_12_FULL_37_9b]|nr:MAG: hypothetical protein A3F58_03385 [Candidatus Roizmanbacteria bacterium RIFCSPHIGHO2_12_FULL_37_9b]